MAGGEGTAGVSFSRWPVSLVSASGIDCGGLTGAGGAVECAVAASGVWVVSSGLGAVRWGRLRVSASIAAEGT